MVNGRKLILGVHGERESYDLVRDPGERASVAEGDDNTLVEALGVFRARVALGTSPARPIDPELGARMRALGYVNYP